MCLGIPGEVVETYERHGLPFARVRFGGVVREVCLSYEPSAGVGEFVLVHVGFAIARIEREQAAEAWKVLTGLGQTDEVAAGLPADGDGS
jgi:hydrogenase expression/formation protein HypC